MKKVVVIIPVYKAIPSEIELLSFDQCIRILGEHPISLVAPKNLDLSFYINRFSEIIIQTFEPEYFKSTLTYNKLLLSIDFYRRFEYYKFMLIYQLDAYVFRDELVEWCDKEYDYIGAPVHDFTLDNFTGKVSLATLNGGFSLRKINSAIRVLSSFRLIYSFKDIFRANVKSYGIGLGFLKAIKFYFTGNNTLDKLNKYDRNEDYFWALICPKLFNWYIVSPVEISLDFSFDNYPEKSYSMADEKLPFGCHAIDKNFTFWQRFISLKQNAQ